jgi:ubiquinone/menaquinone biosynthesis C-methylase UbiE
MNTAEKIVEGSIPQLAWYQWKCSEMEKRLLRHFDSARYDSSCILEIGCGPIGIINYINEGTLYGLDPLEDFYGSNETLTKLRNKRVQYIVGSGEQIPFDDGSFDLVISDNVIDHVSDPNEVMREIYRVLKKGGLLYFVLNVRTPYGAKFHRILSKLLIDKGHPQSFDMHSTQGLIQRTRFSLLNEWISDYRQARAGDIASNSLKDKIKGYTGLSEFIYYAVCGKS